MPYTRLFLCCLFVFAGFASNGQKAERADTLKMICQTWKIKEVYVHNFEDDEKDELDDLINNTRMQFNSDGSIITIAHGEHVKGKWELKGRKIAVKMGDDAFEMKIISLSGTAFHFESGPPGKDEITSSGLLIPVKQ